MTINESYRYAGHILRDDASAGDGIIWFEVLLVLDSN